MLVWGMMRLMITWEAGELYSFAATGYTVDNGSGIT
jgi:hypothetical protein